MPVPYVIHADFESIINPKTEKAGDKSIVNMKLADLVVKLSDMMVNLKNL